MKGIESGANAREKLYEGVKSLADTVGSTLGPNGKYVVLQRGTLPPHVTKDGVTVAKEISFEEHVKNMGAQMVKQAASKTGDQAGDGTTSSTVISDAIVRGALDQMLHGASSRVISSQIEAAADGIIKLLKPIDIKEDDGMIRKVALVSSNGDEEVADVVLDAKKTVGITGKVIVRASTALKTHVEKFEGMTFEKGYIAPQLITDSKNMIAEYENCYVLICDKPIEDIAQFGNIVDSLEEEFPGMCLLVIAPNFTQSLTGLIVVNKRGTQKLPSVNLLAVEAPLFGEQQKAVLEDIAVLTGGTVMGTQKSLKDITGDDFGSCGRVTASETDTTIVAGSGDPHEIKKRVSYIRNRLNNSKNPHDVDFYTDRLAKMTGGVAVIHVGGRTEVEMIERKDRVDDAVMAVNAALEEGIVEGGGCALLRASYEYDIEDDDIGGAILIAAVGAPFSKILFNSGLDSGIQQEYANRTLSSNTGYNSRTEQFENLIDTGVVDPYKVVRLAVENAVSVATTIINCSYVVYDAVDINPGFQGQIPINPTMMGM